MQECFTKDLLSVSMLNAAVDRASDYFLQNRLCRALDDGRLTPAHYARLLSALYHQVDASADSFATAAASCQPSEQALRRCLLMHAEEEKGHAVWIAMDLRDLGGRGNPATQWPSPDVAAYIAYNHYVAQRNPLGRLVIALTLRTLHLRLGSLYADRLRQALNLSMGKLSCFLGHFSSDVERVREIRRIIEATPGFADWQWLAYCARTAGVLYRAIYDKIEI